MKEKVLIISGGKDEIKTALKELLEEKENQQNCTDFESEKLTFSKAAALVDMCHPTFRARVNEGIFKKYGSGRKFFFLKSEVLEALRNSNSNN